MSSFNANCAESTSAPGRCDLPVRSEQNVNGCHTKVFAQNDSVNVLLIIVCDIFSYMWNAFIVENETKQKRSQIFEKKTKILAFEDKHNSMQLRTL